MSETYEFIDAEKAMVEESGEEKYAVKRMCEWLGVSTSGYYEWRARGDSGTARRRAYLAELITKVFEASDATYGHRRVHAQLVRHGEQCTPELVRGIMRELGLEPCQSRGVAAGVDRGHGSSSPPICSAGVSLPRNQGRKWSAISPTFPRGKGGYILLQSSTVTLKP